MELNSLGDNDLAQILGKTVDVHLEQNDEVFTGIIYSLIKSSNIILLLRPNSELTSTLHLFVINITKIASIKLADKQIKIDLNEVFHPNMEKITENEKRNTEKEVLLKRSQKDNFYTKTYQKGYAIFEKLSKFYKCEYKGTKIVMEELDAWIDVPFNKNDLHCENEATKKRLLKMIEPCLK